MSYSKLAAWSGMLLGIIWSVEAMSVSLGEIVVESSLDQPLKAEIPILLTDSEELADVRANLAASEDFERAGVPRPHVLQNLRFQVSTNEQGQAVIGVTSVTAIREPALDFLLEVTTPTLRIAREYTVLLDPVLYRGKQPPSLNEPSSAEREPAATRPVPPSSVTATALPVTDHTPAPRPQIYGPVKAGESISMLGFMLRPDKGVAGAQMAWALFLANPEAFAGGGIHNLRVGAQLRIPTRDEALATPYTEALRLVRFGTQAQPPAELAPPLAETLPATEHRVSEEQPPASAAPADGPEPPLAMTSPAIGPQASEGQRPASAAPADEGQEGHFQLRLLSADEEQVLTGPSANTMAPLPELTRENLPRLIQEARGEVQSLDLENQRLSARLADATQTLRDLRDLAEAREQELQRLRNRLAAARARKRSEEQSAPGITLATAGAPVEREAPPEAPPSELAEGNLSWLSVAVQGLALITVVGLLVWYMLRRQERARQGTDGLAEAHSGTLDELAGVAQRDPTWATPDALGQSEQHKAEAGPDTGQEPDPVAQSISEAEICLAYGQYGVAENILNKLVDSEPENAGHRLRLLHVLHAAHKHESFLEHAQALRSLVEDGDTTTWREAAELGRELFPDEPMFQSAPASEKEPGFEDTESPGVPPQYAISEPAQEQARSAQPPAIDTEHPDLSLTAESSAMPAPFSDEDTVPPLNVTFEEAGAEATTPEQADMDLSDELMAWDAAGSDTEFSAAESPLEEHDPQPEPFTEPDTARGMWDELTLGPGDQDDAPQGASATAPEPDEQDAPRSTAAGED